MPQILTKSKFDINYSDYVSTSPIKVKVFHP